MKSEIETRAKFNYARYALCWEDADVLLKALALEKDDVVLSIAAAGDNSFSTLTKEVKKVYAIDLNPVQIFYCKLKYQAYKHLEYEEFLAFLGIDNKKINRKAIYQSKLRDGLEQAPQNYWDKHIDLIEKGIIHCGKFENYFNHFRKFVLPLAHNKKEIIALLQAKSQSERIDFYNKVWNNKRWRLIFKCFFSETIMGRFGRDKEFFKYVQVDVAENILSRTKYAVTALDTSTNPYLDYIILGKFDTKRNLPHAFRAEHFNTIKNNLDKIEFLNLSIEEFSANNSDKINAFNLSDIFEYMSKENTQKLYRLLLDNADDKVRFAYWNMLAPRHISKTLASEYGIVSDESANQAYLAEDKAFFYSKFYLDKRE